MNHIGLFEGIIINQVEQEYIQLYLKEHGSSDKVSILYQSLYFLQTAKLHFFHSLAYVQYLILGFLRMIDKTLRLLDAFCKTFLSCFGGHFLKLFFDNTILLFLLGSAVVSKTLFLIALRLLVNKTRNSAADSFLPHYLEVEIQRRTVCKIGPLLYLNHAAFYKLLLGKLLSNIHSILWMPESLFRIPYNVYSSYIIIYNQK